MRRSYALFHLRMKILYMCVIQCINTFLHYGIMRIELRKQLYFLIDICNFTLYFMIFYFFLWKASDLLPNRHKWFRRLKIFYVIIMSIMVVAGPFNFYLWQNIFNGKQEVNSLAPQIVILVAYRIPQIYIIGFNFFLWMLNKSVKKNLSKGVISDVIGSLQKRKVNKLKVAVLLVTISNILVMIYVTYQVFKAHDKNVIGKNIVVYFFERANYALVPSILALFFFSKVKCKNKKVKLTPLMLKQSHMFAQESYNTKGSTIHYSSYSKSSNMNVEELDTSQLSHNNGVTFEQYKSTELLIDKVRSDSNKSIQSRQDILDQYNN